MTSTVTQHNADVFRNHGIGGWRKLYLRFLSELAPQSLIDFGCGSPQFLDRLTNVRRRIGIDGNTQYAEEFQELGVEFHQLDLDNDSLPEVGNADVAICSDVFEHLLFPERTLDMISEVLPPAGVLFSHVPNEFVLRKTIRVMLGRDTAIYNHPQCSEFDHPHVHRFTKIGFEQFLQRRFKHNLFISDLRYGTFPKFLQRLGLRVPYALEMGPTFLSTNSDEKLVELKKIKQQLKSNKA